LHCWQRTVRGRRRITFSLLWREILPSKLVIDEIDGIKPLAGRAVALVIRLACQLRRRPAAVTLTPRPHQLQPYAWRGPAGLTTRLDWHADEAEGLVVGACRLARPALLHGLAGRVDRQTLLPVDQ
jgi:hypothetical protein